MAVRGYSEAIFGPASTIDPAMQLIVGAGYSRLMPAQPPGKQGPSYPSAPACPPGFVAVFVEGQYQCKREQLFP